MFLILFFFLLFHRTDSAGANALQQNSFLSMFVAFQFIRKYVWKKPIATPEQARISERTRREMAGPGAGTPQKKPATNHNKKSESDEKKKLQR